MARARAEATNESLIQDLKGIIAEAEEMLKSAGEEGAQEAKAFKVKVQQNLALARERLVDLEESARETTRVATEKAKVAAQAADNYVHQHPWQTIGLVAGLGVLLGLLLNRRD